MRFVSMLAVGLLAGLGACRVVTRQTTGKPIFAHYMIGGIEDAHTRQDIVDAKNFGLDAFALNFDQFADWSEQTVSFLFNNADELGFGLFFSFDHAAGHLTSPDQYADYLNQYTSRPSYFKHNNKPLVSTFGGESITDAQWSSFKTQVGDVLIIPGFYTATPSTDFFSTRPSLDGVFNWNSWPDTSAGKVAVSSANDETYLTAAHSTSKLFMMGISPVQFKHIDTNQNWYRRGEQNLEVRLGQTLALQPDMLQLQSWNDAGEGHWMGNVWPEPIAGNAMITALVAGYDHKGYWEVLPAFIQAWKRGDMDMRGMVPTNGKGWQGVFWHHALTVGASCGEGGLEKSPDITNVAEDAVSGIVLVAEGQTGLVAVVNVGTTELGKLTLVEGYNSFKFEGLVPGKVQVEVWSGSTMVGGGYGPIEVTDSAELCNYNFQVVGFPG